MLFRKAVLTSMGAIQPALLEQGVPWCPHQRAVDRNGGYLRSGEMRSMPWARPPCAAIIPGFAFIRTASPARGNGAAALVIAKTYCLKRSPTAAPEAINFLVVDLQAILRLL